MKILHTADLHLASPMETHLSPKKAELRRTELRKVFSDLMRVAKNEEVSAVLLCGDIADIPDLPTETATYVLDTLASLAPIPVLILRGNHDPTLFGGRALPENVTLFSERWQSIVLNDGDLSVSVSAKTLPTEAETSDAFMAGFTSSDNADAQIVMLHGMLSDTHTFGGEDCHIARKALANRGIDYLALGHIHTFTRENLDRTCTACYAGCPAARGFDECGEKGYVMLQLTKGVNGHVDISVDFRKTDTRTYHHVQLDVSALPLDSLALEHAAEERLAPYPDKDVMRLELIGEEAPDTVRDLSMITARMEDRFFVFELRDSRTVKIDMDALAHDVSLKGVFVKNVLSSELSEEDKATVIRMGIGALRGT